MRTKKLNKFIFNEIIIEERKFMKVSQEVFGKLLGVDGKTISAYEVKSIVPSTEVITLLLKTFQLKLKVIDRFDNETIYE
jgi:DNA-binding transcriptional regulator YiaG